MSTPVNSDASKNKLKRSICKISQFLRKSALFACQILKESFLQHHTNLVITQVLVVPILFDSGHKIKTFALLLMSNFPC